MRRVAIQSLEAALGSRNRERLVMNAAHFWPTLLVALFGFSGFFGLLAIVSPRLFEAIATRSAQWIDSEQFLKYLDRQIDIDRFILPHSRVFGGTVLASVAVLGYFIFGV
jgi:hypothetical protein